MQIFQSFLVVLFELVALAVVQDLEVQFVLAFTGRHRFHDLYGLLKALLLVLDVVERAVLDEPGCVGLVQELRAYLIRLFRHTVASHHVDEPGLGEIGEIGLVVHYGLQDRFDVEVLSGIGANVLVEPDLVGMLDKMVDREMTVQKVVAFLLHLKVFGEFAEKVHERVVRADVLEPGFYELYYLALLLIRRLLYAASWVVADIGGDVVFTEDPEILVPGLEERALRRGLRFLADLVAVGEVVEGVEERAPQTEGKIGCPVPHGPVDLQSRFVETELVNDRVNVESH